MDVRRGWDVAVGIDWDIVPHEHVGPLSRKTTRAVVATMMDEAPRVMEIYKSEETFDAFVDSGVHCYYDDADLVRFVILHQRDSTRCRWDGVSLLGQPINDVVATFAGEPYKRVASRDPEDEFTGFTSALYEPSQVFLYGSLDGSGLITSVS